MDLLYFCRNINNMSVISKEDINVYKELKEVSVTSDAEYNKYFIMNYYQTIPRYYLLCNKQQVNSCIYNFSVGSGKTAAALFVVLNNVDLYKKYIFNNSFISQTAKNSLNFKVNKNVFVIGSWVTVAVVTNELMKEEFGFIKPYELKKYKKLLNSNLAEERQQAEIYKKKLISKISKYINFYGYQAFVNNCFPNLSSQDISQDCKILIDHYQKGELTIDEEFKDRLKNSIIIIDECQKLYSINGMNSYGFAIMCVNKLAQQLGIKMVFLSGTLFNTSLSELVSVVNIMTEHKEDKYETFITPKGIFDDNDCLEQVELIPGYNSMVPTKQFMKVAEELLKDRFIYYDHSKLTKQVTYIGELKKQDGTGKPTLPLNKLAEEPLMLKYPPRENLPIEQHIGNLSVYDDELKSNSDIVYNMLLYSCEVSGYQKEAYEKYLKVNSVNDLGIEDDEDETSLSIHDVGFPGTSDFIKNGIIKNKNEYIGKFLEAENLKKFSAIGYNLIKLCLEKTLHGEKVICYHNKLNNFGIYQYMLILQANGFVKYGDSVKFNSVCKHCGQTYETHNLSAQERLTKACCNSFKPIYYYYLIGDMTQNEREDIVNNVFNSPQNIYGQLLSIMFVSDVAYSGVSFLNTNNIILLSKISNISKWKQICARIIRTKSHVALPENRRYANVYTMVIHYPDERKLTKTQFTYEQKYYILRNKLNKNIEEYIDGIENKTIGYKLFNDPEIIKQTPEEQKALISMYSKDIMKDIDKIIAKYVKTGPNKIWRLNTLIDRLRNNKESYTYINMSKINKEFLISILSTNDKVELFKYNSDNSNTVYIRFKQNKQENYKIVSAFSYKDLDTIPRDKSIFFTLIEKLDKTIYLVNKRKYIDKIIRYCKGDYSILANQEIFWRVAYEIHDEYYNDDETNFIYNHQSEHRNITKVAGLYYNESIILKDGTIKKIDFSFPQYNGWKDIPYRFRISCLATSSASPYYLHVNIIKKQNEQEDGRKISKGVTCVGFDMEEIKKLFKLKKEDFDNKNELCLKLMQVLIDKQYKNMEDRNLYTPFEK